MKSRNLFWGLFFIVAAAVILAGQLGYLASVNIWSLVIAVLLVPIIIESAIHLQFGGILFPFAILAIIFAEPLGIANLSAWTLLAAALFGTIGLSIIFHKQQHICMHCSTGHGEKFDEVVNCPDEDVVDFKVSFGSSIKYINSENFKKANLSCSFGALKVYFDNAKIEGDRAEIHLDISFSGVELFIPRGWRVVNNANISLGGIDEKNGKGIEAGPTIVLTGNVNLAGVEIIYV